jgi:hypothetical protein
LVTLRPVNLRWIKDAPDDPRDLCAHGDIEFSICGDALLDSRKAKGMTVSAAALYLLRTLTVPHTKSRPVGDHLFPHCGFDMLNLPGQEDVAITGCPSGEDFEVVHDVAGADVTIRADDGRQWHVEWPIWRAAVFGFADAVSAFYAACSPKEPWDKEEAAGFEKFKCEWRRRRGDSLGGDLVEPESTSKPPSGGFPR